MSAGSSSHIPTIPMNPKRRYTVRMQVADGTGFTGNILYNSLLYALANQTYNKSPAALPPPIDVPTKGPVFQYCRIVKARAWGTYPTSGKNTICSLRLAGIDYILPSVVMSDINAGSADRPFITLNGDKLAWNAVQSSTVLKSEIALVSVGCSLIDVLIEVW